MKQFRVLLQTEYQKRRSSYWLPLWIIGGVALLILLLVLGALIFSPSNLYIGSLDGGSAEMRIIAYSLMFSMGLVFFVFMLLMAQSSLNRERQLLCDDFFRCQPVSILKTGAAKYLMHVFGGLPLLAACALVTAVLLSFVMLFSGYGFPFGAALGGALLGWLVYLKVCLVIGSLVYLFSAIFKSSAFIKGVAAMGILEGTFALIETVFRHRITLPGIFDTLFSMTGVIFAGDPDPEMLNAAAILGDIRILGGVLFAAICYFLGTYIYRQRANGES
ncbi:MAG: hypothetical protein WCY99_05210, partial [Candidatus Neomarinimicrobiota bacterium]|jgi:hypothetical protein